MPFDPIDNAGLQSLAEALRSGRSSSEEITGAYLERIRALDPRLGAYVHVASREALAGARATDALLSAGTDLGPLMGVPVAIKDSYSLHGMPTAVGSNVDVRDRLEPEGGFVRALKRAGCIVLGKTCMTEFASGTINLSRRPPWNPCDPDTQRMPGGSSSGSAVALAADLCAFSIGSDTGGSVRLPAALCGLFGYKATAGRWPVDGIFPLSRTLDSVGWFTRTAADSALLFGALSGEPCPAPAPIRGLRLGRPRERFFDDLAPEVAAHVDDALDRLARAGVEVMSLDLPEVAGTEDAFAKLVPAELLAELGIERFHANLSLMDAVPRARLAQVVGLAATEYLRILRAHRSAVRVAAERMGAVDAWVAPTVPLLPMAVDACASLDAAAEWNRRSTRNTQPVNYLGQCAVSMPLQGPRTRLPVGLQIACAPGHDARLLSIALALEQVLGAGKRPPVSGRD